MWRSSNFITHAFAAVPHLEWALGANNGGNLPLKSLYQGVCFIFTILKSINWKYNNHESTNNTGYPSKHEGVLGITTQETL